MSMNKVFLLGNVGKDPEVRDAQGVKVASFTLATTDRAYTKQDGTQVPERTEWHNIVAWRGLADICERYVRKGTKLLIIGKLTTRQWEGRDGIKRYQTEVVVDDMELLGQPQAQQQQAYQQPYQQVQQQPVAQPQYQPQPQYQQQPAPMPGQQPYQPQQQYGGPSANDLPFRR